MDFSWSEPLKNKKILLGVCGSIAAYKAAPLVRLLKQSGAEVQVILTESATQFITPLTLSTLSQNPVLTRYTNEHDGTWNNHVELGLWADILLIAPATANFMAKCAHGICDDLLSAVFLSARCPVFFAPAMDLDMYSHPTSQRNREQLRLDGHFILEAEHGELASGLVGQGRLAEPEHILYALEKHFQTIPALVHKKVLITAGPTQEALDPVRYISNYSTGKMGYALADAFARAGANVTLVSGPVSLHTPTNVTFYGIRSAEEMAQICLEKQVDQDVLILTAAVADYRPAFVASQKIKKKATELSLELHKTIDIAATLGANKKAGQIHIGFALETNNEAAHAEEKLEKKRFDAIVLNSLQDSGAGFRYDTNKIAILSRPNGWTHFPLKPKKEVAWDILHYTINHFFA